MTETVVKNQDTERKAMLEYIEPLQEMLINHKLDIVNEGGEKPLSFAKVRLVICNE